MTNKEKYKLYVEEIEKKKKDFIKNANVQIPDALYIPKRNGTIGRKEVTRIYASTKYYFGIVEKQRYRKEDVQEIKEFTEFLENELFLVIAYTSTIGNNLTSGAYRLEKYNNAIKNRELFTSKEEAEIKAKELLDIYGEKEGHINCSYCGKAVKEEDAVSRKIIFRSRDNWGKAVVETKTNKYCPGYCGGYDQMAHEG